MENVEFLICKVRETFYIMKNMFVKLFLSLKQKNYV